ncbi:MAG: plastocyanin/azurin family copper-binding protein [Acidimicrobiales bacterium]
MPFTRVRTGLVIASAAILVGAVAGCSRTPGAFDPNAPATTTTTAAAATQSAAVGGPAYSQSDVPVALSEYKVSVPSTISPGLKNLRISNFGTMQHELLVFRSDLDPSAYPFQASGDIKEEDPSITKVSDGDNLPPGGTQTRPIDLTQPGKYVFVCNLPGHFKLGMFTVVTVAAPTSAPTVTLSEYKVATGTTVAPGKYTYTITNTGSMQHELLVFFPTSPSIDPSALPTGPDGNITENIPGINKISDGDNIDPGKGQTREIDMTKPGTYVFVCNLPGHYKLGMSQVVTVK